MSDIRRIYVVRMSSFSCLHPENEESHDNLPPQSRYSLLPVIHFLSSFLSRVSFEANLVYSFPMLAVQNPITAGISALSWWAEGKERGLSIPKIPRAMLAVV